MSDNENWRQKYRELAREFEVCEKTQAILLEQVHSLAVQLSLATSGQSEQLDRLMSELTQDLNSGKTQRLATLLSKIEKQVRGLDASRVKTVQQVMNQLRHWCNALQSNPAAKQYQARFDQCEKQFNEQAESTYALPEMIGTLLDLQHTLSEADISEKNDDLAKQDDLANARLASGLLELIQRLTVPTDHIPRATLLIQRLEQHHSTEDLDECLKEATELARLSGSGTDADIQAYLSGLNEQLVFLRKFFDTQEEVELQHRQRNNLLDQTVRSDVQVIHQTVQKSQDIGELKKSVNVQLVSIIKAMNQHKVSEQKRIESLHAEKVALLGRLEEMGQQSEQLRKSAEDAHVKAHTDPLTGLPNRLAYDNRFNDELARFNRYGTVFTLCVADIDYFKRVNDEYGHLAGDKVLRLMARILIKQLRNIDFIARFGGEEFVILMPSTDAEAAHIATEKVRQAIEKSPFNFHSQPVKITVSFGLTEVRSEDSVSSMFARADKAMYSAKQKGRNCVSIE